MRLLVVDDEPTFGQFVRDVAEAMGYEVTVTETVDAFRSAYETANPDVVVMDVVMPEEDGVQLMQWLADVNSRARLIIISGFNPIYIRMIDSLASSRGLCVAATLQKPVPLATLRQALS